ncbi:gliding motility protein GldN [Flavobacteriaceae bacterium]|nr:gliding motility protein GldN [Flavobacteriaceae bacterium]
MSSKIKYFIVSLFFLGSFYSVFSQSNLLNAKDPSQIGEREAYEIALDPDDPLEYGRVEDKHILFSKMIWEEIDVSQRVNFPYLYPTNYDVVGKERRPLIHYIREIVERNGNDSISVYEDANGEFNKPVNKMFRSKIWRSYITREKGTVLLDNQRSEILGLINSKELSWPLQVPAQSHPDKSPNSYEFLEKDETGAYTPEEISEKAFDNFYNIELETGALDEDGNQMDDEEKARFGQILDEIIIENLFEPGQQYEWDLFKPEHIVSWKIKGLWYFDNLQSELKYRIIGIAPIAEVLGRVATTDENDPNISGSSVEVEEITKNADGKCEELVEDADGNEVYKEVPCPEIDETTVAEDTSDIEDVNEEAPAAEEEIATQPLFWIFYPQIRKDLAKAYVFSERNSAVRKSFDELINSRRFDAVIYREENVYEDITLEDKYPKSSFMRLIESERIKEKIRNLEHDMWSW